LEKINRKLLIVKMWSHKISKSNITVHINVSNEVMLRNKLVEKEANSNCNTLVLVDKVNTTRVAMLLVIVNNNYHSKCCISLFLLLS